MDNSLYALLAGQHAAEVLPMRCSGQMVARFVRHFEDLVAEDRLPAVVLQGRCLNGNEAYELRRFFRLSAAANHNYVFTCGENCPDRTWSVPAFPDSTVLQHSRFHEVDTGPFVLVVDPRFSGLLAATRCASGEGNGDAPEYEMLWTFDPNVVYTAIDYLIARVAAQCPDHAPGFERALRDNAPSHASLRLTLTFTTKLALLLQRQMEMETATSRISALVNSTFDVEEILQGAADQVAKSLDVARASIAVWGEDSLVPEAVLVAGRGPRPALSGGEAAPRAGSHAYDGAPPPVEVPICSHSRSLGVITVEDDTPGRTWEEEELLMLRTVADHLAVGVSHARLFKHVEEQAITDELTGLYNKRYFLTRLMREMQVAERSGQPLSLVLFDLDHLKDLNDTYGHLLGDAALRHVGATVRGVTRNVDVAARYGGEEFVVILPFTDRAGALLAAERLRVGVASGRLEKVGRVTASFGVATYPGSAATAEDLIDEADRAMYAAKASGRNRVVAFGDAGDLRIVAEAEGYGQGRATGR